MMYGIPGVPLLSPDGSGPMPPVPMEQPKNLFRFGEQSIWSTQMHQSAVAIANGTFRLFTTPLGQVGQGFTRALSIAETNLKEGGRIPSGVAYDVFGIGAQVASSVGGNGDDSSSSLDIENPIVNGAEIAALVNFQNNCVLSWDFTQTQVDIAPLHMIGAGGGTFGVVGQTAVAADALVNAGNVNNGNGAVWLYRKHPVALPGNSTFSVLLRYGLRTAPIASNAAFVIRVVLLGYYKNIIEIG